MSTKKIEIIYTESKKNIAMVLTLEKEQLNPKANIINLLNLGVKISEPKEITDGMFESITENQILGLALMIPIGEKKTEKMCRFGRLDLGESSMGKDTDWLSMNGSGYAVACGIVKNIFELTAYANGSRYILKKG
ncbi:MAG: hypothetical protein NT085_03710 [candidate division SR1 bacterium]|nr:hypothetical protein [candidate division SR1 bacterium]